MGLCPSFSSDLQASVSGLPACLCFTASDGNCTEALGCPITALERSAAACDAGCKCARHIITARRHHCRHHCHHHCRHHCLPSLPLPSHHCRHHCRQRARFCPSTRSSMRPSCRGVGGEEQPYPLWCCRRHRSTKGPQGTRSTYRSGNRVGVRLGLGLSVNEHRQTQARGHKS
jgi:hypothetical protein